MVSKLNNFQLEYYILVFIIVINFINFEKMSEVILLTSSIGFVGIYSSQEFVQDAVDKYLIPNEFSYSTFLIKLENPFTLPSEDTPDEENDFVYLFFSYMSDIYPLFITNDENTAKSFMEKSKHIDLFDKDDDIKYYKKKINLTNKIVEENYDIDYKSLVKLAGEFLSPNTGINKSVDQSVDQTNYNCIDSVLINNVMTAEDANGDLVTADEILEDILPDKL